MAKNNEIPEEPKQDEIKIRPKKHTFMLGITFIASITAVAFTLYFFKLTQEIKNTLIQERTAQAEQINTLQQNQNRIQSLAEANAQGIQQAQKNIQEKIDAFISQMQNTPHENTYTSDDWLLLKARYYIELAQINAHWAFELNSSIGLLSQADSLLKQLNDNKVFDARQAIAKDIVLLKELPVIDKVGLLSQLDAIATSVDTLNVQSSSVDVPAISTETKSNSSWRSQVENSARLLEKLVVIRKNDEDIKPLMSTQYASLLRESIRINLQEAQWAVLNENQIAYNLFMQQAENTLKKAFNPSLKSTSAILEQLHAMQQIKLTQSIPEIGSALPLLTQLIMDKGLMNKPLPIKKNGDKPS